MARRWRRGPTRADANEMSFGILDGKGLDDAHSVQNPRAG
jgi:hypothetical protein